MDHSISTLEGAFGALIAVIRNEGVTAARSEFQRLMSSGTQDPAPAAEEILSVKQAAAFLGISVASIYNYAAAGLIKPHKIGARTMYRRTELVAALQQKAEPDGRRKHARRRPQQKPQ